jgi:hypothetical protein
MALSGWPAIRRAVVLVTLFLLPLLNSARAVAQDKPTIPPDLLDKSLEELMSIQVDSVYGASGFKQAEGYGGARVDHHHYLRRNQEARLPDACGHLEECPRVLREQRPELQLRGSARLWIAGAIQQWHRTLD